MIEKRNVKDYKKLYNRLVNEIESQREHWHEKDAESHSIIKEVRWSEYGRLQVFIIGIENDYQMLSPIKDAEKVSEIIQGIPQHPYHILNDETIEGFTTIDLGDCLLEMAAWKKQQMIEKACKVYCEICSWDTLCQGKDCTALNKFKSMLEE